MGGEEQRGLLDHQEGGRADGRTEGQTAAGSGTPAPGSAGLGAAWAREGGLAAEPTQPIGLRAVTGRRLLPPRRAARPSGWSNVRQVPAHQPAGAVAAGTGS